MAKLSWLSARLPEPEVLPTPSFGLTRALNGGLHSGRFHVYWGKKGSGKTTMALYQIAEAQKQGKTCAIVDSEKAFNPVWAEKCGVDLDALKYVAANSAEQILGLLLPDMEKGLIDFAVVDSLTSINFEAFFEPDKNPMGSYARSSKLFAHKILNTIGPQHQVILISHAAMDLSGQYPVLRAAIGSAIEHWASTIIKIHLHTGQADIREDGARKVTWRVDKSKTSPYPVEGSYYFDQKTAMIDREAEIVSIAVDLGIINSSGAWFYFGDEKYHGMGKLLTALRTEEDVMNSLIDDINQFDVIELPEEEDGE